MTDKNRAKDSNVAREASSGTSSDNETWGSVARIMEEEDTDVQDAWVKNWRRNNSWGIFIAAGLAASAIAAMMAPSALSATTCPEGSELVVAGGEPFCQPTTPLTFDKEDDRGLGRLEKSRDEFPEKRCGSGGEAPTCTSATRL